MANNKHPTLSNGKTCYIEMPAIDINASASFYKEVFGWQNRQRGDGSIAFDDTVGEVSGTWVLGRRPASEPGLLIYIMVGQHESQSLDIEAKGSLDIGDAEERDRLLNVRSIRGLDGHSGILAVERYAAYRHAAQPRAALPNIVNRPDTTRRSSAAAA